MLQYAPLYAKVEQGRDFSRITTIDKSGLLEITYVWDDGSVRVAASIPLSSRRLPTRIARYSRSKL